MTATDKPEEQLAQKTRALNDSLKTLAEEGFEKLAKAAAQATRPAPARREEREIVTSELQRLLRTDILNGITGMVTGGKGGGEAPVSVVVHNNTPAQVSVSEGRDAFDARQLEITIDQMVADSLVRGRQTTGVMRALFGLMPGLSGR